jgi:glycine cleavage system aminomethyltransferase T/glycine/D-amino acid oxidase-like deaminating enzyme
MAVLPPSCEIVIIGGGIVGCSIAYHLAKRGVTDVVLLEQNQLTAGTTWHAAGLVGQLRASKNLTQLARYTTELFAQLESEVGQHTGYKRTGSLSLALNQGRLDELKRQASTARAFGVDVELMSPKDVLQFWPEVATDGIAGAVYLPGDGQTNPVDTTMALAAGARQLGVQIFEDQEVISIQQDGQNVTGVITAEGEIKAKKIVLAAGMWSRQLAAKIGVPIPLQAAEHFYIVTEPMASMKAGMPTLRVPDEQAYFKEDAGKLLLGAFELKAKPWSLDGVSRDFAFGTLPEDLDHFAPILEQAVKRYPPLAEAGIQLFFNGPESFTPDDRYLLGPTPQYDNLFVAAGFNSIGIQSSGGAGKVLADWMIDGHPSMSLYDVNIKRTFPFQSTRQFLAERTTETLGLLYAMHWPNRQYDTARGTRRSAIHEQLITKGAVMGELGGWERPNWFGAPGTTEQYEYSYQKQNWFDNCETECHAIRDRVALFDQSSYPIFTLKGRDAAKVLNHISANNLDVPINRIVYTQWLNERGGIEADVTVTRIATDEFMIVSSCANEINDYHWLTSHIPASAHAMAFNGGSGLTILGVMGPQSRAMLETITPSDISNEGLPYYHSKLIEIGHAPIRANRLSYVGELGFELYVPTEFVPHVFENLVAAGKAFDLKQAGFHAMNACRMEKSYKHMGHDIDDDTNPFTAGLGFAVDMNKTDFIGKKALDALKTPLAKSLTKRLVNIAIRDDDPPLLIHDEPIFSDNKLVGITTSGMWGHRINRSLGIAILEDPSGVTKTNIEKHHYEIEVASKRYPIDIQIAPFYDPSSARMKL